MRTVIAASLVAMALAGCVSRSDRQNEAYQAFETRQAQLRVDEAENSRKRDEARKVKLKEAQDHFARYVACSKAEAIRLASQPESGEAIAIAATSYCSSDFSAFRNAIWESRLFGDFEGASRMAAAQQADWREKLTGYVIRLRAQPTNPPPPAPAPTAPIAPPAGSKDVRA